MLFIFYILLCRQPNCKTNWNNSLVQPLTHHSTNICTTNTALAYKWLQLSGLPYKKQVRSYLLY